MAGTEITDGRLGVLDAARRLRITPELLFSYVKHGAKGRDGRKLVMVADAPGNLFAEAELDAFDAYLREPWAERGADRPAVPRAVRDYLKVEAGGGCARCVSGAPLEEAHIEAWEAVRSHHHHNLIRLCRNCHRAYDEGVISRAEVERLKERCVQTVQRRLSSVRPNGWPFAGAPAAGGMLVGRDAELGEVASALIMGGSVLVEGAGGMGKTQLVLSALRGIEEQRPVVWVGVESVGSPEALEDAIRQRAAEVGLAPTDQLSRMLDDGRACLVLDGVERLPDGRDFVADLIERLVSDTSDTILVVTSQMSLPSFVPDAHIRLRPVDRPAAEAVLRRGLTAEAALDGDSLSALLDFADGHPLTLKILSALVRHFGSGRDVIRRLDELRSKAVLMPGRRRHDATTSLEKSLEVAFADLGSNERKLLWAIAMSPAGFRSGLHPIDRLGIGDAIGIASELRSWNLIDVMRDPAFDRDHPAAVVLTMLSPIRAFALDKMDDEPAEARLPRERDFAFQVAFLISRLQHNFVKEGAARLGLSLMDRELPNAMAVFDLARSRIEEDGGFLNIVSSLANSTMMLLFTSGRFRLGQEIMRAAASDMAEAGQSKEAIHLLVQMQVLAERSGDEQCATFALNEAERLGSGAQGEALAMVRQMQSSAAEHQRDFGAAASLAREALKLYDALGGEQYNAGFAAFQLGRALEFGGDPEAALPFYRRAIEVWDRESDPINRASTYHHIGNCEAYGERWRSAMDAYCRAGAEFVELQAVDYISNAYGEAGLIIGWIDPLEDLPDRSEVQSGLMDAVGRIVDIFREPELMRERFPVSCKKLGGMMGLAVHTGNRDLLEETADRLADEILWPMMDVDAEAVPEPIRMLVFHVQWITQLCAFLSMGIGTVERDEELEVVVALAARGFALLGPRVMAPWIASFLSRVRGIEGITTDRVVAEIEGFAW